MIYIVAKNNLSVRTLIKKLGLKKDTQFNKSEIFNNDIFSLLLKKEDNIVNTIEITNWISHKNIKKYDLYLDLDFIQNHSEKESSYLKNNLNEIIIINKISDSIQNKNYFFDILYKHSFWEGEINILSLEDERLIIKNNNIDLIAHNNSFYSYKVANYFFESHQIIFSKILFDRDIPQENILDDTSILLNLIMELEKNYKDFFKEEFQLTENESKILKIISEKIKLTVTMKKEFINLAKYYKITHQNLQILLDDFNEVLSLEKEIDKKRGKILFEQFKEKIMGK